MDAEDLPYSAEYAKSGRASCKGCKTNIAKDILRLAVMVRSPMFDGKVPHWYHLDCFFNKQRPKTIGDIAHYESLRYEDQQTIKGKIESAPEIVTKKGKKRNESATSAGPSDSSLKDFTIEYSKSSRAMCRGCEQKIMKSEIRVSKKDFESDVGKRYGGQDMWHHIDCFVKLRDDLSFFESGEKLPGFVVLKDDDKKKVKQSLPAIKKEEVLSKKTKLEEEVDIKEKEKIEKEIKEQSKLIFKYRDDLKKYLTKAQLQSLLEFNNQKVSGGEELMLDHLSDAMTFGCLEACKICKNGQLTFNKMGYKCQGDLTEWTKCQELYLEPKRTKFTVPANFKEIFPFLNKYKYVSRKRIINFVPASTSTAVKKEDQVDSKPKVERKKSALYNMNFVISGFGLEKKRSLEKDIVSLGGKVLNAFKKNLVLAVISTPDDVKKMSKKITEAKDLDVHVVSEDFVNEASDYSGDISDLVNKTNICSWGSDPMQRISEEKPEKSKSKSGSMFTKSVPSKKTMTIKAGGAVDPDSDLQNVAHVYQENQDKYTVVLGLTDLQKQKNSYYKIQLLKADTGNCYWVFRSWGRIATSIGGKKLERMYDLDKAKHVFESLYNEKTGNSWYRRANFVKIPGKMYPVDVDYSKEEDEKIPENNVPSKLPVPVQDLMKIIFDVNSMKKVMSEYELDMEKMPLGKLSKKQIQKAFSVLTELQNLIDNNGVEHNFIDASNRFYTFIPHSFGMDNPPIINTSEMVKEKLQMLDNLLELEIAYSLMKRTVSNENENTIDLYYEQLNCNIETLDKDSEDFKDLQLYVKNTHAETHNMYDLEILEVFVLKRYGEEKRFKPYTKYPNRKLLWHGSRTTNFVGLLSQGLRIAPPEAPVSGYMFGKGIYFADMVSKSANYCSTNYSNSVGLLLLCDVALGGIYERTHAEYIEHLPRGMHSTKGLGMTYPNPDGSIFKHGIEIPLGKSTKSSGLQTALLYNEYIVYNVDQVNMKYLVKMNFKFKV